MVRPGALFGTLLLILILFFNPFGLRDASEQHSEAWLLRMLAPFYPESARSDVVVVLIDDQALAALHTSWPLRYAEQARFLHQLVGYRPRAIFVDLLYTQRRQDGGPLDGFRRVLADAREQGVPLILADYLDPTGQSQLLPELDRVADTAPINWSGVGERYPLLIAGQQGPRPTPALRLYQAHCRVAGCTAEPPAFQAPQLVRWGYWSDPAMVRYLNLAGCGVRGERSALAQAARLLLADSMRSQQDPDRLGRPQPCPYTRTLYLNQLRDPRVAEVLRDKLVLLGAQIRGIPDQVQSPVQGLLPGVYWHAMALDNLLVQGPHYWRDAPDLWGDFSCSDLLELLLVLAAGVIAWRLPAEPRLVGSRWQRWRTHYLFWFGLLGTSALLSSALLALAADIAPLDWLGLILSVGLLYAYLGEARVASWWAGRVARWAQEHSHKKEIEDAQS
ncbi:MAG: CHASE2 domain-containing protein [Pseudomonas sp.]